MLIPRLWLWKVDPAFPGAVCWAPCLSQGALTSGSWGGEHLARPSQGHGCADPSPRPEASLCWQTSPLHWAEGSAGSRLTVLWLPPQPRKGAVSPLGQ